MATLLALDSSSKKDDVEWLVYWVVFSTFCLVDPIVEYFVIYWIPFFYPIKAVFLLWMMLPQFKGANVIYKYVKSAMMVTGGSGKGGESLADIALKGLSGSSTTSSGASQSPKDKGKQSPAKEDDKKK